MNILNAIVGMIGKDPYESGLTSLQEVFSVRRSYVSQSVFGFQVQYTLLCIIRKTNHQAFKAARMLDEGSFGRLADDWNQSVFLPKFKELRCMFRLLWGPNWMGPQLCRVVGERGKQYLAFDPSGYATLPEINKTHFEKNGCRIEALNWKIGLDDNLLEENYNMIRVPVREAIENTEEYRKTEEHIVTIYLHRKLELEREFQRLQIDNEHRSNLISVATRQVGAMVELAWNIGERQNTGCVLRGYSGCCPCAHQSG